MKLSELLQTQPVITLALVEESAEHYKGNGDKRGRDAEWYDAKINYFYQTGDSELGLTVECTAKYVDGIASIRPLTITRDSREIWAANVDELRCLDKQDTFWVDNLKDQLGWFDVDRLFSTVPFDKTTTFMLEWV